MKDVGTWLPQINAYLEAHYRPHREDLMQKLAKAVNVTIQQQAGQFMVSQIQDQAQGKVQEKVVEATVGAYISEVFSLALALPGFTYGYLVRLYNETQLSPVTKTNPYSPHDDGDHWVAFVVLSWGRQKEPYFQTNVTYINAGYVCACMKKK